MPHFTDLGDDRVGQAAALAQDVAPELESILLTHYPDSDTLDTFRPGETDLAAVTAMNRAVAQVMAAQGVEVFVQKADRAAFRRWMHGRDGSAEDRRRWMDRTGLLRGAEAFRLLGLDPVPTPKRPVFGKAPGPVADRLLAAFNDEDGSAFHDMVEALLDAGRNEILDLAVRKAAERHGDDAAEELGMELIAAAEAAKLGPSGWAELVALPVGLPAHEVPDAVALTESLAAAGLIAETSEIRFLPGWRSADTIAELSPGAVRRVLLDLLAGREPRDLPPGDTDDLVEQGFGVLLGLQIAWDIPNWEQIAAEGGLPEQDEEDEESPEEARRAAGFDAWRAAMFDAFEGCVPLDLVPPSEVEAEIADFLKLAGEQTGGIEEIRSFVEVARGEAGEEEIVCRAEVIGEGLELSIYTESGRFLDSLTLSAEQMPARAEGMVKLIEAFIRVVKDAPGR